MQFNCPSCGEALQAPDGVFAKEGKCRFCGAVIVSPPASGVSAALKRDAPPGTFGSPQTSTARPAATPKSLARASVVLGVLGVVSCGLSGLAGLVCGITALGRTRGTRDHSTAIAGTVISAFTALIIGPLLLAPVFFATADRRTDRSAATLCLSNAKQLGMASLMYADDNDGRLPPSAHWDKCVLPYVKSTDILACPAVPYGAARYKMNAALGSVKVRLPETPATTVVLFDAAPGAKPFGGSNHVVARHIKSGYSAATFTFADGHAAILRMSELAKSAWKPPLVWDQRPKTQK